MELWNCLLQHDAEKTGTDAESYLTAILYTYPETDKLLECWENERGVAATKLLASYVYNQQHLLFDRIQKKGDPAIQSLINWLLSDVTIGRLETAFYECENEELASIISWAEQILRFQQNRQIV